MDAGTPCRDQATTCPDWPDNLCPCDVADTCDGTSKVCEDKKQPATHVCRPKDGDCDVDGARGLGVGSGLAWAYK